MFIANDKLTENKIAGVKPANSFAPAKDLTVASATINIPFLRNFDQPSSLDPSF